LHVIVFCAKILTNCRNKIPLKNTIFIFLLTFKFNLKKFVSQTDCNSLWIDAYKAENHYQITLFQN
jgi:hypothetical protein